MANPSRNLPTTEEEGPRTEENGPEGSPALLAAFPRQVAIRIPKAGEKVGRAWLEAAGLADGKASREHLRFSRPGGNLFVEDVGSRHGTFVDGIKLDSGRPSALEDGAILRLGQTLLVYREAFEGPLAPQPPLGELVAPWALGAVRRKLSALRLEPSMNILLEGPTGAGKELLAREIARVLGRGARYVPINMASIPSKLFDGHLFGWEKGAFTGGERSNLGVFRSADRGAVFLDELEALPFELQPKLLRFLQTREVFPIAAHRPVPPVDVVVIAATNESLQDKIEKETFRRDLLGRFLYRFELPALEERPEDIFAIFAAIWASRHRRPLDPTQTRVDAEAVDLMMRHDWSENVRELERLVIAVDPAVGLKLSVVQRELRVDSEPRPAKKAPPLTRDVVLKALADSGNNQGKAAALLRISRFQLVRWLRKYRAEMGS